jgi:plastocyanin
MDDASLARWLPSSLTGREVDHNRGTEGSTDQGVGRPLSSISTNAKRSRSSTAEGKVIVRMSILTASLGLIMWAMSLAVAAPPKPQTHEVTIEGMRFQPEVLTVASGDTIVWVKKDLVPHTATSEAGGFDSKDIQADKSWRYTIHKTGDFAYLCTFHPTMKATLRVK